MRTIKRVRIICETQRLIVREWTGSQEELERRFDTYRREEVTKWLGNSTPLTSLEQAAVGQARHAVLLLPMPAPSDGSEGAGEVEIGWHLHPDSWGYGYATEAAKAVLEHGFRVGLTEILAIARPDNEPSIAVMRRLGMVHLGRTSRWYGIEAELYSTGTRETAAGL